MFGLCGDHINAIFEGCADEGIRILDTRDERGAAHMAQGWSLATGEPGVVCVTGGPGLTNAMTAIADAYLAGTPMVVITSRIRLSESGRGFTQDLDQMSMASPMCAWARTVYDPARIPADVAEAFAQARSRRGPALLEVPLDVQLAAAPDAAVPAPAPLHAPAPPPGVVNAAASMLGTAERPIAIVGEGAFWSGAAEALRDFAESARVPVFTVRAARGLLPDDHELCFGLPTPLRGAGQAALAGADAVLVCGAELDIVLAFGAFAPQAAFVRVESDPARVARSRRPDVAVVSDEAAALSSLAGALAGRSGDEWAKELRRVAEDDARTRSAERTASGSPVHPARLVAEVAAAPGGTATFSVDAGSLALWAIDSLPATGPGRMLTSFTSPLATLGPGVPFAMAAKLARPDEPAIALVGDGAFGFSAMEIDTAARHGIAIAIVVGNDAAWGIVKRQMEMGFGRSIAADLADRRLDLLGAALGAAGERVEDAESLAPALARALSAQGPAVVDVRLDARPEHAAMKFIAQMFSPEH